MKNNINMLMTTKKTPISNNQIITSQDDNQRRVTTITVIPIDKTNPNINRSEIYKIEKLNRYVLNIPTIFLIFAILPLLISSICGLILLLGFEFRFLISIVGFCYYCFLIALSIIFLIVIKRTFVILHGSKSL